MEKPKSPTGKAQPGSEPAARPAPAKSGSPAPASALFPAQPLPAEPGRVPALFRKIDWLTFAITFISVLVGYYLTMAPQLTLEDSGELATGSYYAAIPHPPGYPVWTIYTWLWTVLVPVKNVAWRVALGEAVGGALAAGLLALLVSRGSSLLMEGIEELKGMTGNWEAAICMVSGFVSGMLLGFNGFMWSQSVIVEVYAFSVASLMIVLLCLLRWIYAPHQRRYLYLALFFHGLCFTNHQTLIVAAMGIEVAIAAASFRMGRNLFLWNSIVFIAGYILKLEHILTGLEQNSAVFTIFIIVGLCSMAAYFWFAILTRETFPEFCLDFCKVATIALICAVPAQGMFCLVLALVPLAGVIKFARDTYKLGAEWLAVVGMGFCWIAGASFYFYMPLAGMTNPPMEWGYPRTVEGFIHAFSRGQYEQTHPSDIIGHPDIFIKQLGMLGSGIIEEFNWVYAFIALVPFLFFFKLHRRERAWFIGIVAIYACLGVLLLILLNPPADRQAQNLIRVFFTSSHSLISIMVGYGLTLIGAYMATHYQKFRTWGLVGASVAVALALFSFVELTRTVFFGETATVDLSTLLRFVGKTFSDGNQYGVPVYAGLILVGMAVTLLVSLLVYRNRAPLFITLVLFALMPLHSIMTHWSDNEQREHWFGYWFGHDMFTPPFKGADGKPLYPQMTKDAVLFGGTDPGRFCPTYMIFCESFIPHDCQPKEDQNFDRRDVYIITQNALADGTYLNYIRAQFYRSAQIDPPFFQELFRSSKERADNYSTNILARMVAPLDRFFTDLGDNVEKRRRVGPSFFTDKDFLDLNGFAGKLRSQQDPLSKYLYENLSPETQKLISGNDQAALRHGLESDLNHLLERELQNKKQISKDKSELAQLQDEIAGGSTSGSKSKRVEELQSQISSLSKIGSLYDPDRFKQVTIPEYLTDFIRQNPQSHSRIRLNRMLLEAAYPKEFAVSQGGVYPDREIYTPSPDDSQRCFNEYLADAQRRLQLNQLKPGEDVKIIENRVQVTGQIAVMAINGLLTKVIFDHNPKNEFFVEESFPLDWMYPHLTPFGIIMKINRQELPELTDEIVKRDHDFWKEYSKRLTGDIVDYDTPVRQIADWVEKTYLRHDYNGFTGDRRFVRDDQGQKAFSKLRSSIAGVYAWRISDPKNRNPVAIQRMIKEADFAFRQAFAFCPYSPEAVFRYVNLLLSMNRLNDAAIIAETCLKLDPYNATVLDLVSKLHSFQKGQTGSSGQGMPTASLEQLEKNVKDNPNNFQAVFDLAGAYAQMHQPDRSVTLLDRVLNSPQAQPNTWRSLIPAYSSIARTQGIEAATAKMEAVAREKPDNTEALLGVAEGARYLGQNDRAGKTLDSIINNPKIDAGSLLQVANELVALGDYPRLEATLEKLVKLSPDMPEAWYDLSALKISLGKTPEAVKDLQTSFDLSQKRHAADPKALDLIKQAQTDPRFTAILSSPELKQYAKAKP
jgi:tetratricopeptide (TPR) repeat protein